MGKSMDTPASDESAMGFTKLISKAAPSFVSRVLAQLAENVLAVVLMVLLFGCVWYFSERLVPEHDKRIFEGQKQIAEKFIEAGQIQANQFIEATDRLQEKHATEQKHIVEAFTKERERDRERDKEREAMMREIKEWLKQGGKVPHANSSTTSLAKPAE